MEATADHRRPSVFHLLEHRRFDPGAAQRKRRGQPPYSSPGHDHTHYWPELGIVMSLTCMRQTTGELNLNAVLRTAWEEGL